MTCRGQIRGLPSRVNEMNLMLLRHNHRNTIIWLVLTFIVLRFPSLANAQQGPGAAFFSYKCGSSSISFYMQGSFILQASFSEIINPLSTAISSVQNQPIKSAGEVALWALKSDELQIHQIKDPDLTRFVVPSTICGPLYSAPSSSGTGTTGTSSNSAQALAIVQVNGPGQGIAYAQVAPNGQVTAFAAVSGNGSAVAAAQSSTSSNGTGGSVPTSSSGEFHIVLRGENLFRIALNHGTTVAILSQINGITDPTRIYVGQKIYLP
jgi:LysM repeat protein